MKIQESVAKVCPEPTPAFRLREAATADKSAPGFARGSAEASTPPEEGN